MRVRFGLHGDGLDPGPREAAVDAITAGPRGLLRLLESDLGIAWPASHPAEEVGLFRECLAACDDLTRFYHASLAVDPVAAARTLLEWRGQWHLHGWDGTFPAASHGQPRLADMAAVEVLTKDRLPPCHGQRLRHILALLETQRTQIDALDLVEPLADLPPLWRRLAERLNAKPPAEHGGQALPGSDLGKLQATLAGAAPAPLAGDGSVVLMRALSRDVTAQAVAEVLRTQPEPASRVVIADRDGIILDNAFERVGLPRAGFQHYSPFRAASQVLKLALALVWEPLDPHRLLQFLIHPVSPLKWGTRAQLAEAVAASPGIGGPAWQRALGNIGDEAEAANFWTSPPRHAAGDGAPVELLLDRARRCAVWLGERLGQLQQDEPATVFAAAHRQAQAFAAAVQRLRDNGAARIAKIEVDRLVDEVTRSLPDDSTFAEAGHVPAADHPGNVAQGVDEVIWWNISPLRLALAPVFSPAELAALGAAGVALPTPEARIAAATRAWQRPVRHCRRRLVLVVHDEESGRHPLVARLQEQLRGYREVALDEGLLQGREAAAEALAIPTAPLAAKPLLGPRRWWRLGRPLPALPAESYSSMAKAAHHPHQWVLRYHARLRGSRIAGVADGPLLFGSLAHRLFERFFDENASWRQLPPEALDRWLADAVAELVEKEGAVLLERGRGVDRQRVATLLERGLAQLLRHLQEADVAAVEAERLFERPLANVKLTGRADLVAVRGDGARAVLDAKWGSEPFRRRELAAGQQLQLATYGFALAEARWPTAGYYIVTTGNVLAEDAAFFPAARVPDASDLPNAPADWRPEGAQTVWQRSLVTRAWRQAQFRRGEIEVNAGAEPDAASTPPAEGLETRVEADRFDDFRWLAGVEPAQ